MGTFLKKGRTRTICFCLGVCSGDREIPNTHSDPIVWHIFFCNCVNGGVLQSTWYTFNFYAKSSFALLGAAAYNGAINCPSYVLDSWQHRVSIGDADGTLALLVCATYDLDLKHPREWNIWWGKVVGQEVSSWTRAHACYDFTFIDRMPVIIGVASPPRPTGWSHLTHRVIVLDCRPPFGMVSCIFEQIHSFKSPICLPQYVCLVLQVG